MKSGLIYICVSNNRRNQTASDKKVSYYHGTVKTQSFLLGSQDNVLKHGVQWYQTIPSNTLMFISECAVNQYFWNFWTSPKPDGAQNASVYIQSLKETDFIPSFASILYVISCHGAKGLSPSKCHVKDTKKDTLQHSYYTYTGPV